MFYLDEDFRMVGLDASNVVLENRILKEGEERSDDDSWRFAGYYSSIKPLLKMYLRKSLNKSNVENTEELIKELERVEKAVDEKGNKAGKIMAEMMIEADKSKK